MFRELMQRNVVSDQTVAQFCSTACSLVGASVFLLGFRRLDQMELTEAQLHSATTETLLLTAAFIGLALILQHWRRTT